jgi:hypothetical protein
MFEEKIAQMLKLKALETKFPGSWQHPKLRFGSAPVPLDVPGKPYGPWASGLFPKAKRPEGG